MPITKKELDDTIKAVKKAEDDNKKVQARYAEAAKDLAGAIKDRNEAMVKLYRPRLAKVADDIAEVIQTVEGAITLVNVLTKDEEFMEKRFETVEKLLEGVSKSRTALTKQLVDCKKLDSAAGVGLTDMNDDEEDAISEFARVEGLAKSIETSYERHRAAIKTYIAEGERAIKNRDQGSLQTARRAILDLELYDIDINATKTLAALEKLTKKHPKNETVVDEGAVIRNRLESIGAEIKEISKTVQRFVKTNFVADSNELMDPGDEAIDIEKAAKLLGVAKKDLAKLSKVLAGKRTNYEKALAELAKVLDLDEKDGKKIIAILIKGKVIER